MERSGLIRPHDHNYPHHTPWWVTNWSYIMCLLINHPAATNFTFDDISDFYDYNSDGLGIMYAEDGTLHVRRCLPADDKAAWEFYQQHGKGRECVMHFRMRTHGHTDLTNCHPYEVYGDGSDMPLYMAHNGILSTGNAADVSKSDTWHYIRDFVIPLTKQNPEIVFDPAFIDIIEAHIGSSNKFIFMNHEGKVAIMNESAFVMYKGAQLSNTYAWSAHLGGYGGRYAGYTGWKGGNAYHKPANYCEKPKSALDYLAGTEADDVGDSKWMVDDVEEYNLGAQWGGTEHDFADFLFETLDAMGMSRTYKALDWNDAVAFYEAVGDDAAWSFIEEIEMGSFTDSQIENYINGQLLTAAVNAGA